MPKPVRRVLLSLVFPLAFIAALTSVALLRAQSYVNNGAASPSPGQGLLVNATVSTLTFDPATSVTVRSSGSTDVQGASAAVVYVRALCCGKPAASPSPEVSLSTGVAIPPSTSHTFTGPRQECAAYSTNKAYCGLAIVTAPTPSPSPTARLFIDAQ